MTPEAMISIVTGLALGLLALAANRIKLALALGCLVALGVEAYAAWRGPSYVFGSQIMVHLSINVVIAALVFGLMRFVGRIYGQAAMIAPAGDSSPQAEGKLTIVLAHALGLLNIYPFAGLLAQSIVWGFTRDAASHVRAQVAEAVQFQATYLLVLAVLSPVLGRVVAAYSLLVLVIWLAITCLAVVQALRKGAFRYPVNLRVLSIWAWMRRKNAA
ncbi:DUF4870 domain-containing protein [Pseudomonas aeruginosa]|jgi:uncharacterized Tic20 family protein|nr:DUF4870 domain-containing protein [Pseudomonas aeruginosa]